MASSTKECIDLDIKIDKLYFELKKTLGITNTHKAVRKPNKATAAPQTINLEDIAVIKKIGK